MAQPSFVTQAVNFVSAISGGVDTRTGSYNISLNLGKLLGNGGAGPTVPLTLRYSRLSNCDFGIGLGCSLGFSTYLRGATADGSILMLSTGETYGVSDDFNGNVQVQQQLLPSFKFEMVGSGNDAYYRIAHKDGSIEILDVGTVTGVCRPINLISPAGHGLSLTWDDSTNGLSSISDDSGTQILSVDVQNAQTVYNFLPNDTAEAYSYTFVPDPSGSGVLYQVILSADGVPDQTWTFDIDNSDSVWGARISGMTTPGGYHEWVTYSSNNDGFTFPQVAPQYPNNLPYVTDYTRDPGTGADSQIYSVYDYSSDSNFLGLGLDLSWSDYMDPVLTLPYDDTYKYWGQETTQTKNAKAKNIQTKRTYNMAHLQEIEEVTVGGSIHTTTQTYGNLQSGLYLDGNPGHTQQPANYQLQTQMDVKWDNGTANVTETTHYKFDESGNPTYRQDPDGVTHQWAYYDGTTNDPNCPADPNGFTRYVKWSRVNPQTVYSGMQDAPCQQTDYHYLGFMPCSSNASYVSTMVLKSYEAHTAGGPTTGDQLSNSTLLAEHTYGYCAGTGDTNSGSKVDDANAGRLWDHQFLHYPPDGGGSPFKTEQQFDYSFVTDNANGTLGLSTTRTLLAYDKDIDTQGDVTLKVTESHLISGYTSRSWNTTDTHGNVTTFAYDKIGRLTKRTLNYNDGTYQNELDYENHIGDADITDKNRGTCAFQVKMTDAKGNMVCYTLDGMRRSLFKDVIFNDVPVSDNKDVAVGDAQWYTMQSTTYDDLGRVHTTTSSDYLTDGTNYNLSKTMDYDDWGNVCTTTYSDQTVESAVHDPVKRTSSVVVSGPLSTSGTTVTTYAYNFNPKTLKTERYRKGKVPGTDKAYSSQTRQYDGLYLVRTETELQGWEGSTTPAQTTYGYDNWGRVTTTTLPTTADGTTVVTRQYSPKSPGKQVTKIAVANREVGSRIFDGLGRIRRKIVGGRQYTYNYQSDAYAYPSQEIAPDGTRTYGVVTQLDEMLSSVSIGSLNQTYVPDPVSGELSSAQEGNFQSGYQQYKSGRLNYETIAYNGVAQQKATYTYTVGGSLASYQHIDGTTRTINRDPFGRINSVSEDAVTVTPQYDDKGWLTGWTAKDNGANRTLTTTLGLDDFGRETSRTITDSATNTTWTTTQNWYVNDLLQARTAQIGNGAQREDQYVYDARNRLTQYNCVRAGDSAPPFPCDRYGNAIRIQKFKLDPYSNVTMVSSTFYDLTTNYATFNYTDANDPCLLVSGTNSHPSYKGSFTVTYDSQGAGRIVDDGMGTTLGYDPLGRVNHAESTLTNLKADYDYDPHNRLAVQSRSDQSPMYFYYRANDLVNLLQDSNGIRLFRSVSGAPAAQINTGANAGTSLLGTDGLGSVHIASDGQSVPTMRPYSPYGEEAITKS